MTAWILMGDKGLMAAGIHLGMGKDLGIFLLEITLAIVTASLFSTIPIWIGAHKTINERMSSSHIDLF